MDKIIINEDLSLVPYYPYYKKSLGWYQDPQTCKQVDNNEEIYDLEQLKRMYKYLNDNGELYYIKYQNRLIGDASLFLGKIAIVISKEYQNKHLGRKVIKTLLERAEQLKQESVIAEIYEFNLQSQKAFLAAGFKKIEKEKYIYYLK